jgi:hypothetical protein
MKNNNKNVVGMSLEFRNAGIHGNVDSYHDSTDFANSKGQIDSLNYMNTPTNKGKGSEPKKRESIYKSTLQKTGGKAGNDSDSFPSSKEETNSEHSSRKGSMNSKDGSEDIEETPKGKNGGKISRFGRENQKAE